MVFITFETFFLGFEGYQSNITRELRPTLDEITSLNRKIETANNVSSLAAGISAGQTDARKRNLADTKQVNNAYDQAVSPLLSQKQEIQDKYELSTRPLYKTRKADMISAWMNSVTVASGFLLLCASATHIIFALGGTVRQKQWSLIIFTILQPVYWLLHSVAAIRAFYQIFFDPHRWEKTTHGNTLFIDENIQNLTAQKKKS